MERTDEAIALFKKQYGKTPKEAGFPVIGIYERQSAFLYAASEEAIESYKTEQNIIRGTMFWGLWPLILVMINYFDALKRYLDGMHWRCVVSHVFLAVWLVVVVTLYIKVIKLGKNFKLGKNITYLNY
ncbi:MAG: hypothetical protein IJ218_05150 [Alphaproteobacteria bacterium]|nr:hypothetical protein [Alphaproteobacteria bacterium]